MILVKRLLIFIAIALPAVLVAQVGDTLVPLRYNRALMYREASQPLQPQTGSRDLITTQNGLDYIFAFDTMHLPFIDDFSTDKQKIYNYDLTQPGVDTVIDYNFLVNGVYMDYLEGIDTQSFDLTYNVNLQKWDSIANPMLVVIHYEDPDNFYLPTDTDTVWLRPNGYINNGSFVPNGIPADTVFYNKADTLYRIPDDNYSLWTDSYTYINNTFGIDPPTIGVATFDGLSLYGAPYHQTLSNSNEYGSADTLSSKPIYLKTKPTGTGTYNNSDSLYLSFYYQPRGRGEKPDEEDSLVLEFYSPTLQDWTQMWSATGGDTKPFQQVMVSINDTNYFQDGFRFRFRNKATITGNLDHWHIDYVRLDDGRSYADTIIDDVAFVDQATSLLQTYTQVPWAHFKASPNTLMKSQSTAQINNNSSNSKLVNFSLQVDEDGTNIYTSRLSVVPNFAPTTLQNQDFDLENFVFPTTNNDSTHAFNVKYVLNTTPDFNRDNDTAFWYQQFKQAYAYDDGSAELAYSLQGANAELAYEFDPLVTDDSLRGVYIFFPRIYENVTSLPIRFMVWSDISTNDILYLGGSELPSYSQDRDIFVRYEFDKPIAITDKFYIGFRQTYSDNVYIGFDANTNHQDKIFYNVGTGWMSTLYEGSLMIRPDFGNGYDPYPVGAEEIVHAENVNVYPNPAHDVVNIVGVNLNGTYAVYNIQGQLMETGKLDGSTTSIDVAEWEKGFYVIQVMQENSEPEAHKIVIN